MTYSYTTSWILHKSFWLSLFATLQLYTSKSANEQWITYRVTITEITKECVGFFGSFPTILHMNFKKYDISLSLTNVMCGMLPISCKSSKICKFICIVRTQKAYYRLLFTNMIHICSNVNCSNFLLNRFMKSNSIHWTLCKSQENRFSLHTVKRSLFEVISIYLTFELNTFSDPKMKNTFQLELKMKQFVMMLSKNPALKDLFNPILIDYVHNIRAPPDWNSHSISELSETVFHIRYSKAIQKCQMNPVLNFNRISNFSQEIRIFHWSEKNEYDLNSGCIQAIKTVLHFTS